MLVETDFVYPSGKGTPMYSRKGAQTIAAHLCFRADRNDKFKQLLRDKSQRLREQQGFKNMKEIQRYLQESQTQRQNKSEDKECNQQKEQPRSYSSRMALNKQSGVSFYRYTPSYNQIEKRTQTIKIVHKDDLVKQQIKSNRQKRKRTIELNKDQNKAAQNNSNVLFKSIGEKLAAKVAQYQQDSFKQKIAQGLKIGNKLRKVSNFMIRKQQDSNSDNKEKDNESKLNSNCNLHLRRFSLLQNHIKHNLSQKQMALSTETQSEIKEAKYEDFNPYDTQLQPAISQPFRKHSFQMEEHQLTAQIKTRLSIFDNYSQSFKIATRNNNLTYNNQSFQTVNIQRNNSVRECTNKHQHNVSPYQNLSGGENNSKSFHIRVKSAQSTNRTMVDMDRQAGRMNKSLKSLNTESKLERLNKLRVNQLAKRDLNIAKFTPKSIQR